MLKENQNNTNPVNIATNYIAIKLRTYSQGMIYPSILAEGSLVLRY